MPERRLERHEKVTNAVLYVSFSGIDSSQRTRYLRAVGTARVFAVATRVLVTQLTLHNPVLCPNASTAEVGPRDDSAGVLITQNDVDAVVNKAVDAQLEAEAATERAARDERTASEIRQSNRKMLERMRNLKHQVLGHAQTGTQPLPMSLARRARREGRSPFDPLPPGSETICEAWQDGTPSVAHRRLSGVGATTKDYPACRRR
uniref:Uncharacterized protein n=1 Tax=Peronospora matthiolae TaxID=2874970 RepID=A0AAV1VA48_9STRA